MLCLFSLPVSRLTVPGLLSRSGTQAAILLFFFYVLVICFALDCTRAAFALGNSSCRTALFLTSIVGNIALCVRVWRRVACVGRRRAVPGWLSVAWLVASAAGCLGWRGWPSSLFSLSCLGVSPAMFGPIVSVFP